MSVLLIRLEIEIQNPAKWRQTQSGLNSVTTRTRTKPGFTKDLRHSELNQTATRSK